MSTQRIPGLEPSQATGQTRKILERIQAKLGRIPNLVSVMANSPATLQGYVALGEAQQASLFSKAFQEQMALAVAEANQCAYCLSAHTALGKMNKLSDDEMLRNREGTSEDARTETALRFAQNVVRTRAMISDEDLSHLRRAGYSDGEIIEIVFNVVANILTNYINHVAGTLVDFPEASSLDAKAA